MLRLDVAEPPADEREQRIFLSTALLAALYIASILLRRRGPVYGWLTARSARPGVASSSLGVWLMSRRPIRAGSGPWRRRVAARSRAPRAGRRLRDRLIAVAAAIVLWRRRHPPADHRHRRFAVAPALSVPLTAPDSGMVAGVYVREGTRVDGRHAAACEVRDLDLERAGARDRPPGGFAGGPRGPGPAGGPGDEIARLEAERAAEAGAARRHAAEQRR